MKYSSSAKDLREYHNIITILVSLAIASRGAYPFIMSYNSVATTAKDSQISKTRGDSVPQTSTLLSPSYHRKSDTLLIAYV